MRLKFICGHETDVTPKEAPECPTCGVSQVVRVMDATPTFTGRSFGPCSTFKPLEAMPVRLADDAT